MLAFRDRSGLTSNCTLGAERGALEDVSGDMTATRYGSGPMAYIVRSSDRPAYVRTRPPWAFNWRLVCAVGVNLGAWALIGWAAHALLANH